MTERWIRVTFLILITVCAVAPIILTFAGLWPPISIIAGLALSAFLSRGLAIAGWDISRQREDEVAAGGPDTSHTIYVELIDELGALLPKEEQERRLAKAYEQAGPRDVIVPVNRRQ